MNGATGKHAAPDGTATVRPFSFGAPTRLLPVNIAPLCRFSRFANSSLQPCCLISTLTDGQECDFGKYMYAVVRVLLLTI